MIRCWFRKHSVALAAVLVLNAVVFYPVLFMGRVISPNDVFNNFSPWAEVRTADTEQTQNALLNDPPTSWFTLMALARADFDAFHWNPYVGSGIPGFGSSASALLSPFVFLPLFTVPLVWIYTAIVFLKLNASFLFGYLWLREERCGRRGAAIGAIVVAAAAAYSVRWLWQITNATALYPAVLWLVRRALNGKRSSIALVALIALAYALAGFPAAMAYGAWVVVAYVAVSVAAMLTRPAQRGRVVPFVRRALPAIGGVVIAALIAIPSLVPFVQFIRRSGYLELRQDIAREAVMPLSHLRSFVDPEWLGNPAYKNWEGSAAELAVLNNYVETAVYLGLLTIPLALLGLLNRRARARWFWLGVAIVAAGGIFGMPGITPVLAKLPGLEYSALARLALVLPLPVAYLAASARLRWRSLFLLAAVVIALDLGLLAGRFHPYLTREHAQVRETPTIAFLRAEPGPFRIAPFFDYFWPNSAELFQLEDVRSHFGSEAGYRKLLQRIDPTAWSGRSTVLTFNSLQYNLQDPLNGLLGIRWFVEHKAIDIVRWSIFSATVPGVKETGTIPLPFDATLERTIAVVDQPFWSIELPMSIEETRGAAPRVVVDLMKDGRLVWQRSFTPEEANSQKKVWIPLRPYARSGQSVVLRLRSAGVRGWVLRGENANRAETPLFFGRVTTPIMYDRELPDGRLFRNLSELPRFRAVAKLRKLNDEEFLAAKDVDFEREAVITDDPVMPPEVGAGQARVRLTRYTPDEQRISTWSDAPFYLASSEKLTPELAVHVDGRAVKPIETDMLFAGVVVPAGEHEVVFSRRIARGWWWVAAVGVTAWLLVALGELVVALRRSRSAR